MEMRLAARLRLLRAIMTTLLSRSVVWWRDGGRARAGVQVVRPAGRSTWTPALLPACLKPARKRHKNGHISHLTPARFFRDVKPSAQPTQVRTLDLPPPAKTARDRGILRARGPSRVVSLCVILGHQTPLDHAGYGHIADGIGAEGAVHRTACLKTSWPSLPVQDPVADYSLVARSARNGPGRPDGAKPRSRAAVPRARHPSTPGAGSAPSGS